MHLMMTSLAPHFRSGWSAFAVSFFLFSGAIAWAQPTTPPSGTKNITPPNNLQETTPPARKIQRHIGLIAVADQPGSTWKEVTLDGVNWGFGVQWRRKEQGTLFGGGLDLAYQPLGRFTQDVQVVGADGTPEPAVMKLQNQNISLHYALRLAPFSGMIQPFAEGLVGARGSLLSTNLELEDGSLFEHFDQANWGYTYQYGWSGGIRLKLGDTARITLRYADIRSGKLTQVDESSIQIDSDNTVNFETKDVALPTRSLQLGLGWDF
jgi:hypothetical protein